MPNLTAELFTANVLSNTETDLSVYSDPKFCTDLQIHALQAIYTIIYSANKVRPLPKIVHETFKANRALYQKNSANNLNIMDYCIIAGLNVLAEKFSSLGCKPAAATTNFQQRITKELSAAKPEIVINIDAIFEVFTAERQQYEQDQALAKKRPAFGGY